MNEPVAGKSLEPLCYLRWLRRFSTVATQITACAAAIALGLGCRHTPVRVTALRQVQPCPIVPVATAEPTPHQTNQEPALPPAAAPPQWVSATNVPYDGWIDVRQWARDIGIPIPALAMTGTNCVASLKFPTGTLDIRLGRHQARWQQCELWLAHAPLFIRGQPCVHGQDIQSTLLPLLTDNGELPVTNRVIVLDPGHGGSNPGARNIATGRWEKEYTLDLALRLKPLLEDQGWMVFLTRTNDCDVTLSNRVAIADAIGAGLFLSLHFNDANGRATESGIETYCMTPPGLPSALVRGPPENPSVVLSNNAHDTANLRLAFRLHRALVNRTGAVDRGVRRARFMAVLRNQSRPAILVEAGYLSNLRDARLIASPEHRQALALAIADALSSPPPGL
ncbi:MAG: N-acetylmuramoyl-L-alanine amidase [Verrucomicrobiota bacterium]|nr:N-acetylmuramoyl-L-alanine amidase [Verrucomicrobiota bacterium]